MKMLIFADRNPAKLVKLYKPFIASEFYPECGPITGNLRVMNIIIRSWCINQNIVGNIKPL
jgi:hypothetical protein